MSNDVKNIHNLWPLNIGDFNNDDHPQIKEELLNFLKLYEKKLPDGNSQLKDKDHVGNHNLYQSNYDLHNEDSKILKNLFHFIAKSVLDVSKMTNQKFINKLSEEEKKYKVNINESWFIRYNKGGIVYPHHHDGFSWSCVYYVQVGSDASIKNGSTYFIRPYNATSKNDFGSKYLREDTHLFTAKEGRLLVWPSFLYHGSQPYAGDKDRVIISANLTVDLRD
tara:strand:- start:97 stop:762 length:666 start_codon:yes stop_codon:yes gene_type:complete